jgi:hypothetical protein
MGFIAALGQIAFDRFDATLATHFGISMLSLSMAALISATIFARLTTTSSMMTPVMSRYRLQPSPLLLIRTRSAFFTERQYASRRLIRMHAPTQRRRNVPQSVTRFAIGSRQDIANNAQCEQRRLIAATGHLTID